MWFYMVFFLFFSVLKTYKTVIQKGGTCHLKYESCLYLATKRCNWNMNFKNYKKVNYFEHILYFKQYFFLKS